MPRLQDLFSKIPETFSGARLRLMQQTDDSRALQAPAVEDTDADTAAHGGDAEQVQRQEISAFLPLSRWIARVQSPGSGPQGA